MKHEMRDGRTMSPNFSLPGAGQARGTRGGHTGWMAHFRRPCAETNTHDSRVPLTWVAKSEAPQNRISPVRGAGAETPASAMLLGGEDGGKYSKGGREGFQGGGISAVFKCVLARATS